MTECLIRYIRIASVILFVHIIIFLKGQVYSINLATEIENLEGCLPRIDLDPHNYTTNIPW